MAHTHTLTFLPSVRRQVFCVGGRLKMATEAPKLGSPTRKPRVRNQRPILITRVGNCFAKLKQNSTAKPDIILCKTHTHTHTHTLALHPSVRRQLFCVGDKLKIATGHKAWATMIVAPFE